MTRAPLIRPLLALLLLAVLAARTGADDVARLATLARVWAAVKYLHPGVAQKPIDWDGAVVRAIPAVRAATTDEAFARAVGSMLGELGDPVTRVVQNTPASPSSAEVTLVRWEGDTLVISAGPYAEAKSGMALWPELARLSKEIAKAKQVLIDIRHHPRSPDEEGGVSFAVSQLRGLSADLVTAPPTRYVFHSGYRPQQGGTSGGYFSGFLTVSGETFAPAPGVSAPTRVAFVTDAESALPEIAVALHNAGKALIVASAPLDGRGAVTTRSVDLGGPWRALIRLQQIDTEVAADVIAADPLSEALAILNGRKPAPAARRPEARASFSERPWRPDADCRDMVYPDVAHRLLAAFRIWSVIDYFYPYKALIGDWDASLTESIPQFVAASNEDEYARAVLQMVARVEDGHSTAFGHPAVSGILGTSRVPLEVREVEKAFVVTKLHDGLPAGPDVRVGDVVVSVDGEPFEARVARLRAYVTASTDTARMNRTAAVALAGPPGSTAALTVRGADDRPRTVQVPRVQAVQPRRPGEPYRVLDGDNIGYVDLTRLTVPQVDAMFDALKGTSAVVFDMRGYPQGTAWSIAPRINTKGAKIGAIFRRAQVSGVTSFEEATSGFYFEQPLPATDKPRYTGKVVMLIDDRAISQAEHTGLFFEAASDITFIGTPTAGANGDVTNFFVPGGFRIGFTGHDVRHADGRQLQRVGIQPHVRIAPTIQGLRAGRDEVLERAIAYVTQRTP
jgi:C-terminal processing protease CtpA/Prc